jgi:hypothetical protein
MTRARSHGLSACPHDPTIPPAPDVCCLLASVSLLAGARACELKPCLHTAKKKAQATPRAVINDHILCGAELVPLILNQLKARFPKAHSRLKICTIRPSRDTFWYRGRTLAPCEEKSMPKRCVRDEIQGYRAPVTAAQKLPKTFYPTFLFRTLRIGLQFAKTFRPVGGSSSR